MWTCQKCGKAVFFAERRQSIGYDWHPQCLQCTECGKILLPGQHAEHKSSPYCHIPCYAALFGPQLFGHGTRVESHSSFGKNESKTYGGISRSDLEVKLKSYNQFFECKNGDLKSREVNGRMVLEGVLKIYWGVQRTIHLKEEDDEILANSVRRRDYKRAVSTALDFDPADYWDLPQSESDTDDEIQTPTISRTTSTEENNNSGRSDSLDRLNCNTRQMSSPRVLESPFVTRRLQSTIENPNECDRDPAPQKARRVSSDGVAETNSANQNGKTVSLSPGPKAQNGPSTPPTCRGVSLNAGQSRGSTAIRRQPGRRFNKTKLKRRCSINGHFYNRDTSVFTPPHGSLMSVWISSLVSTQEVLNMLLEKYKIESQLSSFALYVIRENGEARRLRDEENPLLVRVILGPREEAGKLYLMDSSATSEISSAVAQYLNLSSFECHSILTKFAEEEEREVQLTKARYSELRRRIQLRMDQLKVKL